MTKRTLFTSGILALCVCALLLACKKKDKSPDEEPAATFDKQAMLANYADQVIVPSFSAFKISFDSLHSSYDAFKNNRKLSGFQDLKLKLHAAYRRYQRISLFGMGPAEDQAIRANFNVFPTNKSLVESNISSGNYNLNLVSNLAAKGFPALDYIFVGTETELKQFNRLDSSAQRRDYVSALLNDMKTRLDVTYAAWTGNYRNTFVNSLATDIGSSIGLLINQLNYELDYLKNAKLGIPLGLKSGGTLLPDNCEAYYGGQSAAYVSETLRIIEDTYLGRSLSGADGKGFDDYVKHLGLKHVDKSLDDAIRSQFAIAHSKVNAIGNPLADQVVNNYNTVKEAYNELVKLLVLLKTDLPSGLGVVITYQDGDGD